MRRTIAALLVAFLALLAGPLRTAFAGPGGDERSAPAAAPRPVKAVVGVWVDRITSMSLRENHFDVDFYVWFRWTGDASFDPLKSFDLANGSISSRANEVREEHEGYHYASCRVTAEVTQFFDVSRFPLDDHVLRLDIEDTEKEADFVEYEPDAANSGVAPDVQVPGWSVARPAASVGPHHYATNYGVTDLPSGGDGSDYSRYSLEIPLRRDGGGYFAKLFFGLFIAVGIALLAFHIRPTDLDPRFGLPVGSIFAAVGSLYVTSGQLPDTSVITLSDRLHILSFVVIFVSLIESTISLKIWSAGNEEASKRMDRISFWVLGGLFAIGATLAVVVS